MVVGPNRSRKWTRPDPKLPFRMGQCSVSISDVQLGVLTRLANHFPHALVQPRS